MSQKPPHDTLKSLARSANPAEQLSRLDPEQQRALFAYCERASVLLRAINYAIAGEGAPKAQTETNGSAKASDGPVENRTEPAASQKQEPAAPQKSDSSASATKHAEGVGTNDAERGTPSQPQSRSGVERETAPAAAERAPTVQSRQPDAESIVAQPDSPDADGWRPSDDTSLLDSYVGMGLSVKECAEMFRRETQSIRQRLTQKLGVELREDDKEVKVPVSATAATESVQTASATQASPELSVELAQAELDAKLKTASAEEVEFVRSITNYLAKNPVTVAQLKVHVQSKRIKEKINEPLRLALLARVLAAEQVLGSKA